jgi:hypothetical protein
MPHIAPISRKRLCLLLGLLLLPACAQANMGVPVIAASLPGMLLLLAPVVLLEAAVYCRALQIRYRQSLRPVLEANVTSTLLGIPLAWALHFMVQSVLTSGGPAGDLDTFAQKIYAVTVHGAWLGPYYEYPDWMLPAALMVGMVPAFFMTVLIESRVMRRLFPQTTRRTVHRSVWQANLVSYALLLASLVYGVLRA